MDLPGGYLNAGDGKPGRAIVLVIQEWWGVNAQIKSIVDRYTAAGFIAFAPDLYDGVVVPLTDEAKASQMAQALDWPASIEKIRRSAQALAERYPGGKVGITGFCLGGAVSISAAAAIPELQACVPFYGIPGFSPKNQADFSKIRGKLQGHYADRDGWVTPERVKWLEERLVQAGVPHQLHRYDADHAFFNDARPEVYSPHNAQLAWTRAVDFLKSNLEASK